MPAALLAAELARNEALRQNAMVAQRLYLALGAGDTRSALGEWWELVKVEDAINAS